MAWKDLSLTERFRVGAALHPEGRRRFVEHEARGDRFAHYTSADAAVKMITGREVWMRRANAMNDFSELEYGIARLETAQNGRAWTALGAALDAIHDGVREAIEAELPHMIDDARSATFLTALSRHRTPEDGLGRLSMWRAYGGSVSVCLVLAPGVLLRHSSALNVFNHPVSYLDDVGFEDLMLRTAAGVLGELALLRNMHAEEVITLTLNALRDAILCTKHPGFAEEREWRLIHSPRVAPSNRVPCVLRTIGDQPQPLHLLPLRDVPEDGLWGLEPAALVEQVIIGPSDNPAPTVEALVEALRAAGARDAERRVAVSTIPLRRTAAR